MYPVSSARRAFGSTAKRLDMDADRKERRGRSCSRSPIGRRPPAAPSWRPSPSRRAPSWADRPHAFSVPWPSARRSSRSPSRSRLARPSPRQRSSWLDQPRRLPTVSPSVAVPARCASTAAVPRPPPSRPHVPGPAFGQACESGAPPSIAPVMTLASIDAEVTAASALSSATRVHLAAADAARRAAPCPPRPSRGFESGKSH